MYTKTRSEFKMRYFICVNSIFSADEDCLEANFSDSESITDTDTEEGGNVQGTSQGSVENDASARSAVDVDDEMEDAEAQVKYDILPLFKISSMFPPYVLDVSEEFAMRGAHVVVGLQKSTRRKRIGHDDP
jgi:hypothetical protein